MIVVNTCAFIDRAKQESVDAILEMARQKEGAPDRRLVVTGCLAQRYDAELRQEIPEIDATLGTGQVEDIVAAVEGAPTATDAGEGLPTWVYDHTSPRVLSTPPWLAYVKISEGCDYTCSFCIIPTLRGRAPQPPRWRTSWPRRGRWPGAASGRSSWWPRTPRATAWTSGCATASPTCCGAWGAWTASAGSA